MTWSYNFPLYLQISLLPLFTFARSEQIERETERERERERERKEESD